MPTPTKRTSNAPTKPATKPATKVNRLVSSLEGDGFLTPTWADTPLMIYGVTPTKRFDKKTQEMQHGFVVDCEPIEGGKRVKLVTYAQVIVDTLTRAVEENLFPCEGTVSKPAGKNYYVFAE